MKGITFVVGVGVGLEGQVVRHAVLLHVAHQLVRLGVVGQAVTGAVGDEQAGDGEVLVAALGDVTPPDDDVAGCGSARSEAALPWMAEDRWKTMGSLWYSSPTVWLRDRYGKAAGYLGSRAAYLCKHRLWSGALCSPLPGGPRTRAYLAPSPARSSGRGPRRWTRTGSLSAGPWQDSPAPFPLPDD